MQGLLQTKNSLWFDVFKMITVKLRQHLQHGQPTSKFTALGL